MKHNQFSQYSISRFGLGTVKFGFDYGINNPRGQVPFTEICKIFEMAHKNGMNFIDTSRFYGTSEENIERALRETGLSTEFTICTKLDLPRNFPEWSDKDVISSCRESLDTSLETLKLERIPFYLLHNFDYKALREGLIWNFVLEEKEKGKLDIPGISIGVGPEEAFEAGKDESVKALQIPYNIFDSRWRESGFFTLAGEKGIALFSRSTYLQGLLLMNEKQIEKKLSSALPYIKKLRMLLEEFGIRAQEVALRYVASEESIFSTVIGVDSSEQYAENLEIIEKGPLPNDLVDRIHAELEAIPEEIVNPSFWNKPYKGHK